MLKPELNQDVDIDTLSAGSRKECVFQCLSNSKHIFKKKVCKMISYRDGRGVGCKFCGPNRSEAFPGDRLLYSGPESKGNVGFRC